MQENHLQTYLLKDHQLRAQFLKIGKRATYGTAGFRDLATNIPYIVLRTGAFVAILNQTNPTKSLGVVISASHNKREDNGVKITNFKGNMLQVQYEPQIEAFVNEEDFSTAVSNLKNYLISKGQTIYETDVTVLIGGDTRPSTVQFLNLVTLGVQSQGGKTLNFHLTTTPQLQYYVYHLNEVLKGQEIINDPESIRQIFWERFSEYFLKCANYLQWKGQVQRLVDCANGVGGLILPHFSQLIQQYLRVEIINQSDGDFLNKDCGADHVKTTQKLPINFQPRHHNTYLSFDGDADRVVFYTETAGHLNLIDGDRTGTVFTQFFKKTSGELRDRTLKINNNSSIYLNTPTDPSIGFVQTYYANYSSSEYLRSKYGMEPALAATGVKNLHEKAQHYDIGIYFEGNGHGTVIFNEDYLSKLLALINNRSFLFESETVSGDQNLKKDLEQYFQYLQFYVNAIQLSNPSVGDAICDFLLFEIALKYLHLTYDDTLKLYTDLQSLTSKIAVKNKGALKVTKIEDKVVQPAQLQLQIEQVLQRHKGKKAFLRASGTEDVLRLHVQAQTREQVLQITRQIQQIVSNSQELN